MATDAQILNYLENCLANDSLAHAYLFIGPKASGRLKILEDFLPKLVAANSLNHPDIKIVEPDEGTVTIDQIRQLRHWLNQSPIAGASKAAIIDGAEKMNEASQNAFLKALEEPVANTCIFLLVSHRRALLPTIYSRVVPLYFTAPPAGPVEIVLLKEFLVARDASERLRLWLKQGIVKENMRDWLYKIVPELRQLLLARRSAQLAKTIKSLLDCLAGPSGQNWQLIAENIVISI